MADISSRIEMALSLVENGQTMAEVRRLMQLDVGAMAQLEAHPDFIAGLAALEDATDGEMSAEDALNRATQMAPAAFDALEAVISDRRAPASSRVKAAETALGWRQELAARKREQENRIVYNLVIDERVVKRMDAVVEMLTGEEGQKWLQEMSQVMPNSTV